MRSYLLVALGGALGASIRWGVAESIGGEPGSFPWATLIVNLVGCALIGLAARHLVRTSDRWLAGVTGLLGGLTTYSAFAVETRDLLDAGRSGLALTYVAVSIAAGLAATELARGDWGDSVTAALFVVAAGLGAAARLRINQYGWTWLSTLFANVIGAFGLGWLLAASPSEATATVIGTGFFGSLTTFSMFTLEATEGAPRRRIAIIASTLVLGLAAATAGHTIG